MNPEKPTRRPRVPDCTYCGDSGYVVWYNGPRMELADCPKCAEGERYPNHWRRAAA
jgi:hypothetical protein